MVPGPRVSGQPGSPVADSVCRGRATVAAASVDAGSGSGRRVPGGVCSAVRHRDQGDRGGIGLRGRAHSRQRGWETEPDRACRHCGAVQAIVPLIACRGIVLRGPTFLRVGGLLVGLPGQAGHVSGVTKEAVRHLLAARGLAGEGKRGFGLAEEHQEKEKPAHCVQHRIKLETVPRRNSEVHMKEALQPCTPPWCWLPGGHFWRRRISRFFNWYEEVTLERTLARPDRTSPHHRMDGWRMRDGPKLLIDWLCAPFTQRNLAAASNP